MQSNAFDKSMRNFVFFQFSINLIKTSFEMQHFLQAAIIESILSAKSDRLQNLTNIVHSFIKNHLKISQVYDFEFCLLCIIIFVASFFYSLFYVDNKECSVFSPSIQREVIKMLLEIMFFYPRNFVDLLSFPRQLMLKFCEKFVAR